MFAYIDPAVGATIMQLVVAGTVGVGAIVKLKWHTIKRLLGRSPDTGHEIEETPLTTQHDKQRASD